MVASSSLFGARFAHILEHLSRSVMVAGYDRRAMTARSAPGVGGVLLSGGSRHNPEFLVALRLPYAVAPGLANPAGCPAAWPPVVG